MTRIVTITQASDTVRCSSEGHAEYAFTVTNTSGAPLRIGARVLTDNPVQASWMSVEGPRERELAVSASDQVRVRIQAPADASPGRHTFRLLVYSVRRPGEDYTESETVAFEVPPKAEPAPPPSTPKRFPWWIPAVIAIVLIGGGIGWWLWPSGVEVPNVVGQPLETAKTRLQDAKLMIAAPIGQQQTDEHDPNTVLTQEPPGGTQVEEGVPVNLTVAVKPPPPQITSFEGVWKNKDPNTQSITKLAIVEWGNEIAVHAQGKCHPQDCDWGVEKGTKRDGTAVVNWDQGFVTRKMRLTLDGGQLVVVTDSRYRDDRLARQSTNYFTKFR